MSTKPLRQIVFEAVNHHPSELGVPPYARTDVKGRYCGYFENENKEQFVFMYEYEARRGSLWAGDNGWETPVEVIDGDVSGLALSKAERLWLTACWLAATEFAEK